MYIIPQSLPRSQSLRRCEQEWQVPQDCPGTRFRLGMDTVYVTLWRIEQDFYVGDEEGRSGLRERQGQSHRGEKFHGPLRNTGGGQPWL